MKLLKIFFLILLPAYTLINAQNISIGERHSFNSEILNEERSYQVYLPSSYHTNALAKFPVLYILDGDYNFHYDTGLVEFLSNTAFTIPEMIVIGISDNGSAKQLENSDPNKNADVFIKFIQEELKPTINKNYRTDNLNIIAGHSKFGLLATHYWITNSQDFNTFIAIDPSYWFNENEIIERLNFRFDKSFEPKGKLIIAQANTPGMGIDELVGVLNEKAANSNFWTLKKYPNDNHGSLHIKALSDALNLIFTGWEIDRETFYSFNNANDVIDHFKKLKDKYNTEFILPSYSLNNVLYYYDRKNELENINLLEEGIKTHFPASLEGFKILIANSHLQKENTEKALAIFMECLDTNPNSFKSLEGLFKVYKLKDDKDKANVYIDQAIEVATKMNARQFYLNELNALKANLN